MISFQHLTVRHLFSIQTLHTECIHVHEGNNKCTSTFVHLLQAKKLLQDSMSDKDEDGKEKEKGPLIGNMVWMVADEQYTHDDGYYIYPSKQGGDDDIVKIMKSQSAAVQGAVTNKPASMAKAAKRLPTIIGDGPLLGRDGLVF